MEMLEVNYKAPVQTYPAVGNLPPRFPHWKWGEEYEELVRNYPTNGHKIIDIVVSEKPNVQYHPSIFRRQETNLPITDIHD